MEGCIVSNTTAKSPVWVHFGFSGNADGTVMTKKYVICCICSQEMPYKNNTLNCFLTWNTITEMSMHSFIRQNPVNPPQKRHSSLRFS